MFESRIMKISKYTISQRFILDRDEQLSNFRNLETWKKVFA